MLIVTGPVLTYSHPPQYGSPDIWGSCSATWMNWKGKQPSAVLELTLLCFALVHIPASFVEIMQCCPCANQRITTAFFPPEVETQLFFLFLVLSEVQQAVVTSQPMFSEESRAPTSGRIESMELVHWFSAPGCKVSVEACAVRSVKHPT